MESHGLLTRIYMPDLISMSTVTYRENSKQRHVELRRKELARLQADPVVYRLR
jgi:hypothetical protein